jgi:hypothetical protein
MGVAADPRTKPVIGGDGGSSFINFGLHPKQVTDRSSIKGRLFHLLIPF